MLNAAHHFGLKIRLMCAQTILYKHYVCYRFHIALISSLLFSSLLFDNFVYLEGAGGV